MESFLRSDLGCPNENMSELDMISKVYENTLKQLHELKVQSLSNKSTLKEFFLRSLITSEFISDSDRSKIKEYVFNIEFENLILISISIDNINDMPADKMYSHKIALCKTIPQLIKNDFRCEVVNMPDGEIALLLNFRNKDKNSFDLLLDSLGKIREISKQLSNTTVTIGIGGIANSIDECAQAYKKAVEMVKYRFVLGLDKTIYKKYLDENICTNLCYPNELEDKLISSIRLNKREDFIDVLESMIDIIQYHSYPETVSAFFNITTACIKTINQVLAQSTNKYYLNFDEFRNIFSKLLTIDQAKKWLLNLFDEYQQIVAQISNLKNTKHYSLVNKIQDYIKQNFHNPNLSVESIADLTGYTSYYFSKIFKDILGININEYIKQLRINKAKELLETTDYKTNNISDMCGFTNVSNFYLVFKKEVGLTPSLYREYVRQGGDVKP